MKALSGAMLFGMFSVAAFCQTDDPARTLAAGNASLALKQVDGLLTADPDDVRLLTIKGLSLAQLHREKEALTSFEHALKLSPKAIAALRGAAETAYTARDAKAAKYVQSLLAVAPDDPAGHAIAGVLAFEARDCPAAVSHFAKSDPLLSGNAAGLAQYGECLARMQRYHDAAAQFEKVLAAGSDNAVVRYNLALCRYLQNDAPGAIDALQPLVTSTRADSDALNLLAAAENETGNVTAATDALKRATEVNPGDIRNYIDLALLCLEHNAQDLATEVLSVGVGNNPKSARLLTMRGAVYAQGGHVEEAQADFDEASRLEPDRLYGSVGLSMLLRQAGQADSAAKLLEDKLALSKDDPVVNFLLADVLWREGIQPGQPAFSRAKEALFRAIRSKPDFAKAHAALAKLYRVERNNAAAITELQLALRYEPNDRVALNQLVLALRAAGRNEEAHKTAELLRATIEQESRDEVSRNRIRVFKGQ